MQKNKDDTDEILSRSRENIKQVDIDNFIRAEKQFVSIFPKLYPRSELVFDTFIKIQFH